MLFILIFLGGALLAGAAVFFYSRRYVGRILSQTAVDSEIHHQRLDEMQQLLNQEQRRGAMLEEQITLF